MKQNMYKAFGLTIDSYLQLPELSVVMDPYSCIDVSIKTGDLDAIWSEKVEDKHTLYVKEMLILFRIDKVATFLIRNGNEIIVSPVTDTSEDALRLYLLGTCMGAILMQRKILPLHGSAIVIDKKAYAIVGDSGAGKSTLASAFLQKGYQLLTDDIIPVVFSNQGKPVTIPAYPYQKLWIKTLDYYGRDTSKFKPIIDRETKFSIPVSDQFTDEITPLAGVFELTKSDNDHISINLVEGLERFQMLFKHTYRNFFLAKANLMEWHFQTSVQLATQIPLYRIHRPTNRFTADELVDLMLETIERSKISHE
ncbi:MULTISPECIES: aldolase [Paraliobacillus]|uniref:aldolase n=1 Tax=Paraliobacillus TaxID=200903 RepID=UPI000DD43EF3|nr:MULTISPECIES: aldolase [Paraliobacillus]